MLFVMAFLFVGNYVNYIVFLKIAVVLGPGYMFFCFCAVVLPAPLYHRHYLTLNLRHRHINPVIVKLMLDVMLVIV